MNIIVHRRNKVSELTATNRKYGVEVDIRSKGNDLLIHHDPFVQGESFEAWIEKYQHGTLILNVKEEGLEKRLTEIMESKNITDYFFLDQSFPFLIKSASSGESRCAVRVSEYESIETALSLSGKIEWIWVDCFTHFPLLKTDVDTLKSAGFKLCVVSPELQGRGTEKEIYELVNFFQGSKILVDAVCTKRPDIWEELC